MPRPIDILLLLILTFALTSRGQEIDWSSRAGQLEAATGDALEQLKQQLIAGGMPAHLALKNGTAATAALRAELRQAIRARRDSAARASGLLMHEWGALAYDQGIEAAHSDTHRDGAGDLPQFVQVWSELAKQAVIEPPEGIRPGIIRIRKPIVYFYTDKPQTLTYSVACPHGMFTEWFPKANTINPDPAAGGPMPTEGAMIGSTGLLVWRNFDLVPGAAPDLAKVPQSAWWWPICRDTDSTPIKVDDVVEKFLYYRATVTDTPPIIEVDGGANKKYTLAVHRVEPVQHILLIHIENGKAISQYIPKMTHGEKRSIDLSMTPDAQPIAQFAPALRRQLNEILEEEGLFPKEAAGMTQIWQKDWFETDGVRVIYLNPLGATASLMPMKLNPAPVEAVRTYVIAIECLKDSVENLVKQLIANLADGKYAVREAAQRQLLQIGKRAEPALREELKTTEDEEVRNRINVILQRLDPRASIEQPVPAPRPNLIRR